MPNRPQYLSVPLSGNSAATVTTASGPLLRPPPVLAQAPAPPPLHCQPRLTSNYARDPAIRAACSQLERTNNPTACRPVRHSSVDLDHSFYSAFTNPDPALRAVAAPP